LNNFQLWYFRAPKRRHASNRPLFLLSNSSVVATGGVYKGQGRIQRKLMTRIYKEFLVHELRLQSSIPEVKGIRRLPDTFRRRNRRIYTRCTLQCSSRAAQDIKGHTDLLLSPISLRLHCKRKTSLIPSKEIVTTNRIRKHVVDALIDRLWSCSFFGINLTGHPTN